MDLSKLPPPNIIEQISFEKIFKEMQQQLVGLFPMVFKDDSTQPILEKAEKIQDENGNLYFRIPVVSNELLYVNLPSDPSNKLLSVWAYRECLVRQRINDATRAVMLAYAFGSDLDQHGANYGVPRLVIDAGDPNAVPPIEPTYEKDEDYRRRLLMAFSKLSVAGSESAYLFHTLSAHEDVEDASIQSINAGEVLITVQSRDGDGTASDEILNAVQNNLSADDVRPLTDEIIVQSVTPIYYTVEATLYIGENTDSSIVLNNALKKLQKYVDKHHKVGGVVALSGIYSSLEVEGVEAVLLENPKDNLIPNQSSSYYCENINLTTEVATKT